MTDARNRRRNMNEHCIGNGRTADVYSRDDGSVLKLFRPFTV